MTERTYTKRQIADARGVSMSSISNWRYEGRIPSPIALADYQLVWSEPDYQHIITNGPQAPGTYEVKPFERKKRSAHIQLKIGHLTPPIRERTLPGGTPSQTVRWIVEQYLALMATIDALNERPRTEVYISDVLTEALNAYDTDKARRHHAQEESQR